MAEEATGEPDTASLAEQAISEEQTLGEAKEEQTDANPSEEQADANDTPREEYKKLEDRYKNLEKLLGRQSNEIGYLRKLAQEREEAKLKSEEQPLTLDNFVKDPQKAIEAELSKRQSQDQRRRMEEETVLRGNVETVYNAIPNFDNLKNEILTIAKEEDGIDNVSLQMIDATISRDPVLAISYAKRALMKQKYEGMLKNGKATIEKAASATKNGPSVGAKSSVASKGDKKVTYTQEQLQKMSSEDLKKALREMGYNHWN